MEMPCSNDYHAPICLRSQGGRRTVLLLKVVSTSLNISLFFPFTYLLVCLIHRSENELLGTRELRGIPLIRMLERKLDMPKESLGARNRNAVLGLKRWAKLTRFSSGVRWRLDSVGWPVASGRMLAM
jgi:hypothetical protein